LSRLVAHTKFPRAFEARLRDTFAAERRGVVLDLPTSHRVPVTWIRANASAPIRWRTLSEVLPPGSATKADFKALRDESLEYQGVRDTVKRQKDDGSWGGNILGVAPDKSLGIKEPGSVPNFRHLLELGVGTDHRAIQLGSRLFFRILSRDPDPALYFEYNKLVKKDPECVEWARGLMREGVTAALCQAGMDEDPRVRGSAHRIATAVSQFLRSQMVEDPFIREGNKYVLHPEARPPTLFTVEMFSFMPSLQRERAGLLERLIQYLTQPAPKKNYTIKAGASNVAPVFHLLGDPLELDSAGRPKDLPFALHWLELLARMGMLEASHSAQRALSRIAKDCDNDGVWTQKNLRAFPKSPSQLADHAFPLEIDTKSTEARRADVTFRMALIAKLAGWELEYS
jgi:TPR repeat protein